MNRTQQNVDRKQKPKFPSISVWIWLISLIIVNYFIGKFFMSEPEPVTISYTLFKEEVKKKNVEEIYSKGSSITGNFIKPVVIPIDSQKIQINNKHVRTSRFITELPSFLNQGFETFLDDNGVIYSRSRLRKKGVRCGIY